MNKRFDFELLSSYTKEHKLPLNLHWDITESCNLRCKHCFINKSPKYVDLSLALSVISFIKEKGILFVTLSGGEAILHPYFKEIYMALKKEGFLITIFTNGTNFSPEIKSLLKKYKPYKVEVSIYGTDEETYYEFTGVHNKYSELIQGLEFLSSSNIKTTLKVPITIKSQFYIEEIIKLSNKYSFNYRFGSVLLPMLEDGDQGILSERLPSKTITDIIFRFPESAQYFKKLYEKTECEPFSFMNKCASLTNSYMLCINRFQFCINYKQVYFEFEDEKALSEAFDRITDYRNIFSDLYDQSACGKCSLQKHCLGCPAYLMLENKSIHKCSQYLKDLTIERLKKIEAYR